MKTLLASLTLAVAAIGLTLAPDLADAKRLGGGRAAGMQRSAPTQPAAPQHAAPTQNAAAPAAPAPQPAAPAATPPKRSWLGPIAGLAAGLGLAALFSHFGMGEGLANFVMLALLAVVTFVAIRWLVARFAKGPATPSYAPAGGGAAAWQPERNEPAALPSAAAQPAVAATTVPGGMASAEFERLAKLVFIRMQAANDTGNIDDLRKFTTPELFASLRLDLQDRGGVAQQTDVVQLDAKVVDTAEADGQSIVSVRFSGLIRESADAGAAPFAELWHLVRPASGEGDWKIAGIQPQG